MSLSQTNNSLQSQYNFGRSTFVRYSAAEDFISLNKLVQFCEQNSIKIIQLPDKRLETGLNLIPLKVKSNSQNSTIIIFLTKYSQNIISVTAYNGGKIIDKANAKNEEQISKFIKKLVESNKFMKVDYQPQSLKAIEKLEKKCSQIAKQQKNEMMVIQSIKSSPQYQALIELQIQLVMEVDSLSQSLADKQKTIQQSNPALMQKLLAIEKLKSQIQQNQYEYEEVCKNLRNIKQLMTKLMERQQQKISKLQITNQNQLNDFLIQAKKLKKLELQKRFIH